MSAGEPETSLTINDPPYRDATVDRAAGNRHLVTLENGEQYIGFALTWYTYPQLHQLDFSGNENDYELSLILNGIVDREEIKQNLRFEEKRAVNKAGRIGHKL